MNYIFKCTVFVVILSYIRISGGGVFNNEIDDIDFRPTHTTLGEYLPSSRKSDIELVFGRPNKDPAVGFKVQ